MIKLICSLLFFTVCYLGFDNYQLRSEQKINLELIARSEHSIDFVSNYFKIEFTDLTIDSTANAENINLTEDILSKDLDTIPDLSQRISSKLDRNALFLEISKSIHRCYSKVCGWDIFITSSQLVEYRDGDIIKLKAHLFNGSCNFENHIKINSISHEKFVRNLSNSIVYEFPSAYIDSILLGHSKGEVEISIEVLDMTTNAVDTFLSYTNFNKMH